MTMRRVGLTLLFALTLQSALAAPLSYKIFEAVTVDNTSGGVGFTRSLIVAGSGHKAAQQAWCRLETAEIRYTWDGTPPTTTVGTLLEIGDVLILQGTDVLLAFRAIRTGGSSGKLDCTYSAP